MRKEFKNIFQSSMSLTEKILCVWRKVTRTVLNSDPFWHPAICAKSSACLTCAAVNMLSARREPRGSLRAQSVRRLRLSALVNMLSSRSDARLARRAERRFRLGGDVSMSIAANMLSATRCGERLASSGQRCAGHGSLAWFPGGTWSGLRLMTEGCVVLQW